MMETGLFFHTLLRAGRDLARPRMLFCALWPPLAAFVLWSIVAWFAWQPMAGWVLANLPDWPWLDWLGPWLSHVAVFFVFAPLIYFTTLMFVAIFALPRMMAIIAARDYPDLSRQASTAAAFWGSLANTATAGLIFVVGWLITLPMLFVPGGLFVLPLFWSAWLNQRAFRFDAIAEHATAAERAEIVRRKRPTLYLGGLIGALIAYVPVANFFALPYTAILFVHLCLTALRELRRQQKVVV
ncbi:EI24 domain-containing protein [Sulfuricystis multivorans]|uniref:EI24 domain-containing protein n=1 Tax=Sulfuricystis multivorans TaxID=2211108 RepID=UPI000F828AE1|nr:EI24 domain-containing protein [Sulfuricystis multivorans]